MKVSARGGPNCIASIFYPLFIIALNIMEICRKEMLEVVRVNDTLQTELIFYSF